MRRSQNSTHPDTRRPGSEEGQSVLRLSEFGMDATPKWSLKDALTDVVDTAIAITGANFGNVQLLDPASNDLTIVAQRGFPDWWLQYWQTVSKGQGTCGTALDECSRVIVEDVENSPIFVGTPALDIQLRAGVRAVQSTPLIGRSGRCFGMFSTHYNKPCRPDSTALRLLDLLARQVSDIVERAYVEQELFIGRERLELALRASNQGTWDSNRVTGKVFFDEAICAMLGYRQDEMAAHATGCLDLVHPIDRQSAMEAIREHEQGETASYQQELRCKHKDGHWVWVLSLGKIVARDATGKALRLVGTWRDISAEKQLREQGTELLKRVENMMQGVLARKEMAVSHASENLADQLSRRQRQILIMIAHGMTSEAIAQKLHIATATVVTHRRELMRRLDLHSAAEVTRFALQNGLLNP